MPTTIEDYHPLLNRSGILPPGWLARNHPCYPLVGYLNIITGLYLSQNYAPIALFVKRALEHILSHEKKLEEAGHYRRLALDYLSAMARFLVTNGISDDDRDLIPPALLPDEAA